MSHEADWTYSGNPADSDLDAVRFILGDTDIDNPLLNDSEINYLIANNAGVGKAASQGARTIASQFGSKANKTVGDLSIRYNDRREFYLGLAENLEAEVARGGLALTGITGGRGEERDPMFWLGMQRFPGEPVTTYSPLTASLAAFSYVASTSTG